MVRDLKTIDPAIAPIEQVEAALGESGRLWVFQWFNEKWKAKLYGGGFFARFSELGSTKDAAIRNLARAVKARMQ